MKMISPILLSALCCGCVLGEPKSSAAPLANPPAPFKPKELVKAAPELQESLVENVYAKGRIASGPRHSFSCGDKTLYAAPGDRADRLRVSCNRLDVVELFYWGSTKAGWGFPFNDSEMKLRVDKDGKTIDGERKFEALAKDDSTFFRKVKLLPNGKIELSYSPEIAKGGELTDRGLFIRSLKASLLEGSKLTVGDKSTLLSLENATEAERTIFNGPCSGEIKFFADRPEKSFSVEIPEKSSVTVKTCKPETGEPLLSIRIQPPANTENVKVLVDLGGAAAESLQSEDTFAGINFWKNDRLHIPNYAASKNLLPNPSFEEGLQYWRDFGWSRSPGVDRDVFSIDNTLSFAGKRSLKVKAWKDNPDSPFLASMAIPCKPGVKHAISFYAKADSPSLILNMRLVGAVWDQGKGSFDACSFPLEQNGWKRFSKTFTTPNAALSIMFDVSNRGPANIASAWIDAMQLEESEGATDYVEPPVAISIMTSKPGNFLATNDKIDAKIRIDGPANAKGCVACEATDFFYAKPYSGRSEFTTDARGEAIVPLPLDGKLGKGEFCIEAKVDFGNGIARTEFNRISIIDPAPSDCPQKRIFGFPPLSLSCSRPDFLAARLASLGFGSICYLSREMEYETLKRHGIWNSGDGIVSYGPSDRMKPDSDVWKLKIRLKNELYSDALRDEVERVSYEFVKGHPWVDTWFLQAESNAGANGKFRCLNEGDVDGFAKLILACRTGTLKANSTLKFMPEGGPTNMNPAGGTAQYDQWLTALEKLAPDVRFDFAACHTYTATPEDPDMDYNGDCFIKMIDRHSSVKGAPVYWNEGSYYCPWVVPEWDLNLGFCDQWNCGFASYHMGWAERVSAAWNARCWLVALKYSDRVKQQVIWGGVRFILMDAEGTTAALGKVPNTLCRLLGDSTFKRDIRFAVNCRAYVFEDGQGRPVAAVWSHIPEVDRGLEQSPVAKMNFTGRRLEFIDLMENPVEPRIDAKGRAEIPVTPFPLFIRGKKGDFDALCSGVANCEMEGLKEFQVSVGMKLKSRSLAELSFSNRLSKPFSGVAEFNGEKLPLTLPESATRNVDVKLKEAAPFDAVAKISFPLILTESNGSSMERDFSLRAFAIAKAGSWDDVPWIALSNSKCLRKDSNRKPGSFSGEFKMRWTSDKLCLLAKIADDKPSFPSGPLGADYKSDSIQVYIDTYGDNANRKAKAIFDFNDYSYCISRDAQTGKARVWREAAPAAQIGDAYESAMAHVQVNDIPVKVEATPDGYVYEIEFPRASISPLKLENGSFARIGISVNGNDGNGRDIMLVNTASPNSEPYTNPEEWPAIILSETGK